MDNNKEDFATLKNELADIINNLKEIVWSYNVQVNQLSYINKAAIDIYGYKPDEFYHDPELWSKLIHPDDQMLMENAWIEIYDKGFSSIEYRIIHKNGKTKYLHDRAWLVRDDNGGPIRVDGIATDITEQKELKKDYLLQKKVFKENETNLQALINNTKDVIWSVDKNYQLIAYNLSAQYLFKEYYGLKIEYGINLLEGLPEETKDFWKVIYNQSFSGEQFSLEWIPHKKRITFQVNVSPISNEESCIIGAAVFCSDITERKIYEEEMNKSRKKAENALRVKSEFLSTMSHEIRTPLNAIIGFCYILLDESPKPEQIKSLNILKFSAENLLNLLDDILDYNKLESGNILREKREFDLEELSNNIISSFRPIIEKKKLSIHLDHSDKIPKKLIGDNTSLFQILNNLISNAVKFTHIGKIILSIEPVSISNDKVNIHFAVSDTGIGMSNETIQKLFQVFTQGNSSSARKYEGAGLGLAITKKLLEINSSEIKITSEVGKGSRFEFEIKFDLVDNLKIIPTIPKPNILLIEKDSNLENKKILIVDDNEVNLMLSQRILKKWKLEVHAVTSGIVAIEKTIYNNYDAILMDVQMPEMDGIEATQILRKRGFKNPVIAFTADIQPETKEKVFSSGMNAIIHKPFQPDILRKLLIQLIA